MDFVDKRIEQKNTDALTDCLLYLQLFVHILI